MRSCVGTALEHNFPRELNGPRGGKLRGHRAEGGARRTTGARRSEHRRIESIIRFSADLQVQPFPQPGILEQRQI